MSEGYESRPFESRIINGYVSGNTGETGILNPSTPIPTSDIKIISAWAIGSFIVIPMMAQSDQTWRFVILNTNLQKQTNASIEVYYTGMYV